MPSDAFRCKMRRWWGICGMTAMAPLVGLWECSVVGAAVAVHLWNAGGSRQRIIIGGASAAPSDARAAALEPCI